MIIIESFLICGLKFFVAVIKLTGAVLKREEVNNKNKSLVTMHFDSFKLNNFLFKLLLQTGGEKVMNFSYGHCRPSVLIML